MKKLLMQAIKFVGLSGIGWLLDFCIFILLGFVSANHSINNFISSWVGVTFVFIFATRKVFKNNCKLPLWLKDISYILYQFILITLASKVLGVVDNYIVTNISWAIVVKFSGIIAKIFITPFTMVLNFFVMKGVIEKL